MYKLKESLTAKNGRYNPEKSASKPEIEARSLRGVIEYANCEVNGGMRIATNRKPIRAAGQDVEFVIIIPNAATIEVSGIQ